MQNYVYVCDFGVDRPTFVFIHDVSVRVCVCQQLLVIMAIIFLMLDVHKCTRHIF